VAVAVHAVSARLAGLGLLIVGALAGCRAAPAANSAVEHENAVVRVDLGVGSPDGLARRAACELADSTYVSWRATRAGPSDDRLVVRFTRPPLVGSGTQPRFETMVENELLATGRFLIAEDPAAPLVRAGVRGELGAETLWVLVRGPGGELWLEVVGRTGA